MRHERHAVVFDLDDTLYPYRQHKLGAFRAVAAHLERRHQRSARTVFGHLLRAVRDGVNGCELQACLEATDLPSALVFECLEVIASYQPELGLPASSSRLLTTLRSQGWRLGVLTNGPAAIQRRKVRALRLPDRVDALVYATTCGSGVGKPEREPFHDIARRLDVEPAAVVFVGDDERCDIAGAIGAGMQTIRCCAWVPGDSSTRAGAVIDRLSQIPDVAHGLVEEALSRHAA